MPRETHRGSGNPAHHLWGALPHPNPQPPSLGAALGSWPDPALHRACCPSGPFLGPEPGITAPRLPFLPPRGQSPPSRGLAEGCFCPDGSVLFSSNADVCVPQCRKRPTSPDQPAGGRGRPWGGNPWLEPLQPGLRTLGPGCTHLWTPAPTQSGVVRPRTLLGPLTLQQLEIWAKEEAPAGGGEARPAGSPGTPFLLLFQPALDQTGFPNL